MAKKDITYNEAVSEIDTILNEIENEELDIDQLSEKVKRVSFLIKTCKNKLHKTESEIQKVLDNINLE